MSDVVQPQLRASSTGEIKNVDIEKFCNFILNVDKDENITNTYLNDINTNNELHFTIQSFS